MGMFNLCLGLVFETIISLCLHFGIHQSVCGWLCSGYLTRFSESEITFFYQTSLSVSHTCTHTSKGLGWSLLQGRSYKISKI